MKKISLIKDYEEINVRFTRELTREEQEQLVLSYKKKGFDWTSTEDVDGRTLIYHFAKFY